MKTILNYPFNGRDLFVLDEIRESVFKIASKISEAYNKLPSQEMWNNETIHTTIRQIDYYRQSKVFTSDQDVIAIYKSLLSMIDHLEMQAEVGFKYAVGGKPTPASAPFKIYVNEFILGDNCVLAVLNDMKVVYLNHTVLNISMTKDPVFYRIYLPAYSEYAPEVNPYQWCGGKRKEKVFNSMREKVEHRLKPFEQ
jgi:hypothetical protein